MFLGAARVTAAKSNAAAASRFIFPTPSSSVSARERRPMGQWNGCPYCCTLACEARSTRRGGRGLPGGPGIIAFTRVRRTIWRFWFSHPGGNPLKASFIQASSATTVAAASVPCGVKPPAMIWVRPVLSSRMRAMMAKSSSFFRVGQLGTGINGRRARGVSEWIPGGRSERAGFSLERQHVWQQRAVRCPAAFEGAHLLSIHSAHCWPENRGLAAGRHGVSGFNPLRPLLAGERALWLSTAGQGSFNPLRPLLAGEPPPRDTQLAPLKFQSTPAIAGRRTSVGGSIDASLERFNPLRPLLAGEPPHENGVCAAARVSIHSGHCWPENERNSRMVVAPVGFQSTPAIAGRRT